LQDGRIYIEKNLILYIKKILYYIIKMAESYEPSLENEASLFLNKLYTTFEGTHEEIMSKMKEHLMQNFFYIFKKINHYEGIEGYENNFYLLNYREGSPTWKEWARKGRGTILYFDKREKKFIIFKQLLQRGAEMLSRGLKSKGVQETQDSKQIEGYSESMKETDTLLNTPSENFNGVLSMKVDGSLTSISFFHHSTYQAKILRNLLNSKFGENEGLMIGKILMDISIKTGYLPVFSTQNTLFMGFHMWYYNVAVIIENMLGVKFSYLKDEIKTFRTPREGLIYLVQKYYAQIMNKLVEFIKDLEEHLGNSKCYTLLFESVCPNRTDIFGNTHTELAISYQKSLFRFLGVSFNFREISGDYLPHSDPLLQPILREHRIRDPLFWFKEDMDTNFIESILNNDLTLVIEGKKDERWFVSKNKPNNLRELDEFEPLDFEGFILYRILLNSRYDYNKLKHQYYYIFHKLNKALEKRTISHEQLLSFPDKVAVIFPALNIYRVFNSKLDGIFETILTNIRYILKTTYLATIEYEGKDFTDEMQRLLNTDPEFEKLPASFKDAYFNKRLKAERRVKMLTSKIQSLQETIRKIIIETISKNGIVISEEMLDKSKSALSLFDVKGFNIKIWEEDWKLSYDSSLPKIKEVYYPLIVDISVPQKDQSRQKDQYSEEVNIRFMTFNIMSQSMYAVINDPEDEYFFRNAHGLLKRFPTDQITEQEKRERLDRIIGVIKSVSPDILLLQEANVENKDMKMINYPENEIQITTETKLISDPTGIGFKCKNREKIRLGSKHHKQQDATKIYYNPDRFNLFLIEAGCLGRISNRKSNKYLLDQKPEGREDYSGTGYTFALLGDLKSKHRIFVFNVHVKILEWSDPDYSLVQTAKDLLMHIKLFLNDVGELNATDKLILAGDFNADNKGFYDDSDFNEPVDRNQRYWNTVLEILTVGIEAFGLGSIIEVNKGVVTSNHCTGNTGNEDDHIFVNDKFSTEVEVMKNRLFPLLRNCMGKGDYSAFMLEYSRVKSKYKTLNSRMSGEEILQITNKYIAMKEIKGVIDVNNIIRNHNLVVSDHYPKIVNLKYTPKKIREILKVQQPEEVLATTDEMEIEKKNLFFSKLKEKKSREALEGKSTLVELDAEPVSSQRVKLTPRPTTTVRTSEEGASAATAVMVQPDQRAEQLSIKPLIKIIYAFSTIGVGKNFLFERMKGELDSKGIKTIVLESDLLEKGKFGQAAALELFNHKRVNGDLVLILNKNTPPNSWSGTTKEYKQKTNTKKLKIPSFIDMLSQKESEGFDVQKYALQFPRDLEQSFSIQEYIITLKRLFKRVDHPGKVDSSDKELVLEVFAIITLKAWSKGEINKYSEYLSNYKLIIPVTWFDSDQHGFNKLLIKTPENKKLGIPAKPTDFAKSFDKLIKYVMSNRNITREGMFDSLNPMSFEDFVKEILDSKIDESFDLGLSIKNIIDSLFE
jgi:hypothetical protein